jgi:hypothetical protein
VNRVGRSPFWHRVSLNQASRQGLDIGFAQQGSRAGNLLGNSRFFGRHFPPPAARYDGEMGKRLTFAFAVLALLAVSLAVYSTGYFWLGERRDIYLELEHPPPGGPSDEWAFIEREYPHAWQAAIFKPAGWIEGELRRKDVDIREAQYSY